MLLHLLKKERVINLPCRVEFNEIPNQNFIDVKSLDVLNTLVPKSDALRECILSEKNNDNWPGKIYQLLLDTQYALSNAEKYLKNYNRSQTEVIIRLKKELADLNYAYDLMQLLIADRKISKSDINKIKKSQKAHRQEDINRLAKTLVKNFTQAKSSKSKDSWREKLLLVLNANPDLPLKGQLGFEADRY